jgi:hypothetical protein
MNFNYFPGSLFLFLIVVFPQGHQLLKGLLLIIVFIQIGFISFKTDKIYLSKQIFYLFIFYLLLGSIFGFYGYSIGNPGAGEITKEVVVYVFIAMILISGIRQIKHIKSIHNTLVFSTFILTAYIVITILNANGIWPDWLYANLGGASGKSVIAGHLAKKGRIEIGFSSLPSFLFLQPYMFCFLLTSKGKISKPLLIVFIISTSFMIFSGSRILLLGGIIMPIVITFYVYKNKWLDKKAKKKIKSVIIWAAVSLVLSLFVMLQLGLSFQSYSSEFFKAFLPYEITNVYQTGEDRYRNVIIIPNRRLETIKHLYSAWAERPIFGAGSGAVYWEYIRSGTEPWKYELTFVQFLYQWGILGCGLYLGGFVFIFRSLAKVVFKKGSELAPFALSSAFGSIAYILGSATNPFLLRFDSIFAVFIPIAVLNIYLMNSKYRYKYIYN